MNHYPQEAPLPVIKGNILPHSRSFFGRQNPLNILGSHTFGIVCYSHRTVILGCGVVWNSPIPRYEKELRAALDRIRSRGCIVPGCCLDNSSCYISRIFVSYFSFIYVLSEKSTTVGRISNIRYVSFLFFFFKCLDIVNI